LLLRKSTDGPILNTRQTGSSVAAQNTHPEMLKTIVSPCPSAHQIMAVTGHQTLEEVERYTRAANRRLNADDAMKKLL
jgi:hypothetical protein